MGEGGLVDVDGELDEALVDADGVVDGAGQRVAQLLAVGGGVRAAAALPAEQVEVVLADTVDAEPDGVGPDGAVGDVRHLRVLGERTHDLRPAVAVLVGVRIGEDAPVEALAARRVDADDVAQRARVGVAIGQAVGDQHDRVGLALPADRRAVARPAPVIGVLVLAASVRLVRAARAFALPGAAPVRARSRRSSSWRSRRRSTSRSRLPRRRRASRRPRGCSWPRWRRSGRRPRSARASRPRCPARAAPIPAGPAPPLATGPPRKYIAASTSASTVRVVPPGPCRSSWVSIASRALSAPGGMAGSTSWASAPSSETGQRTPEAKSL